MCEIIQQIERDQRLKTNTLFQPLRETKEVVKEHQENRYTCNEVRLLLTVE
ncbi:MAG: hypothetical protein SNG14_04200 [Rikenellaceae bacterium]